MRLLAAVAASAFSALADRRGGVVEGGEANQGEEPDADSAEEEDV